jgi:hypothetical protein
VIRTPLFVSALAGVSFGLVAAARSTPVTTGEAVRTDDGPGFVGSWRLSVFEAEGPPTLALASFGADGTLVAAEHPVVTPPVAPGAVFASAWHGAWTVTGPDTAVFTAVGLGSLGQGTLFAVLTVRAGIALEADRRTLTGEFAATVADPEGTTLAIYPGTLRGTRIVAESPG